MRVGLISDTHGLLRPEALAALQGVDHIIHGGDIGNAEILQALNGIAPVSAVRGNNDTGSWAGGIAHSLRLEFAGVTVLVIHDAKELRGQAVDADVVVSGHSHRPVVQRVEGVLYVNPGSAGPRRFRLPIAVGMLELRDGECEARIIDLA